MKLALNAMSHLLVDGLCLAALCSGLVAPAVAVAAVLLYDTLAFSTQCVVGLAVDRVARGAAWCATGGARVAYVQAAAMLGVVAGYATLVAGAPWWLAVVLVGLGNSVFHVAGGAQTLADAGAAAAAGTAGTARAAGEGGEGGEGVGEATRTHGGAWRLGVFVASGALGVTLGTVFPQAGVALAVLTAAAAAAVVALARHEAAAVQSGERVPASGVSQVELGVIAQIASPSSASFSSAPSPSPSSPAAPSAAAPASASAPNLKLILPALLLLALAVAVRAVGGAAVAFPWKTGAAHAFALTAAVAGGKVAGGFLCDALGARATAWLSLPAAAVCVAFFAQSMPMSLLGQLLLNLSMPVTLWLMYRALPDDPAFAFGLAASALWPGTLVGLLLPSLGGAAPACVLVCFGFGLGAILYAARRVPGALREVRPKAAKKGERR